jgi:hypothetical protein
MNNTSKLTRKQAVRIERNLKDRGAYKPYVTMSDGVLSIESYPLTAYIRDGFDRELGPTQNVRLSDCTLPRLGQESLIATLTLQFGQCIEQHVSALILQHHQEAYARAKDQESAAVARCA